jgi:hypothetical protein
MPLPLGPQTGSSWAAATAASSASSAVPDSISPKPAPNTTAPPQPSAPASSTTLATPLAGIATTTASGGEGQAPSDGKQGRPYTVPRFGLTPQTSPG